jgi:hypothetical protein
MTSSPDLEKLFGDPLPPQRVARDSSLKRSDINLSCACVRSPPCLEDPARTENRTELLARRHVWKPRLQRLAAKQVPDPSEPCRLNETVSFPQSLCHCMRFSDVDAHEFGIFDSAFELRHPGRRQILLVRHRHLGIRGNSRRADP